MKILIYQDYLRTGGTEFQSLHLADRFQREGHTVRLLTNRPGGKYAPVARAMKIEHLSLQNRDSGWNWYAPGLLEALSEFLPDVVLLMGRNANGKGWRVRRRFPDLRMIGTIRTGRRLPLAYRRSLRCADLIFCNSEYAKNRLKKHTHLIAKAEVHANACFRAELIREACKEKVVPESIADWVEDGRQLMLFVGAFVPGKNHRGLLRMVGEWIQKRPAIAVVLAGEGPERPAIEAKVKKNGWESHVRFLGFVPEIERLYPMVQLVLSPSLEESMPNAIVEAQYGGLPVVAFDAAGVKECFLPGETGMLIRSEDESGFVRAVIQLLDDPSRRERMAEKSRIFASKQFDPERCFNKMHDSVLRLAKTR